MTEKQAAFFVGWGKIPKDLRVFLAICALGAVAGFAGLSYAISATQDDPGDGAFMGGSSAVGVLQIAPYPVLHVIEGEGFEPGDAILLTGSGKRGVAGRAAELDGQVVQIAGARLKRGDLDGMQLRNGADGLRKSDAPGQNVAIETERLGRWRLTGEICDGKCLNGAMRPGKGLSHKACANLCLIGGAPPVFVSSAPIGGGEFLLMADAGGGSVTEDVLDFTATYVEIEGEVERRGGLLVFRIAPDSIRLAE